MFQMCNSVLSPVPSDSGAQLLAPHAWLHPFPGQSSVRIALKHQDLEEHRLSVISSQSHAASFELHSFNRQDSSTLSVRQTAQYHHLISSSPFFHPIHSSESSLSLTTISFHILNVQMLVLPSAAVLALWRFPSTYLHTGLPRHTSQTDVMVVSCLRVTTGRAANRCESKRWS